MLKFIKRWALSKLKGKDFWEEVLTKSYCRLWGEILSEKEVLESLEYFKFLLKLEDFKEYDLARFLEECKNYYDHEKKLDKTKERKKYISDKIIESL